MADKKVVRGRSSRVGPLESGVGAGEGRAVQARKDLSDRSLQLPDGSRKRD